MKLGMKIEDLRRKNLKSRLKEGLAFLFFCRIRSSTGSLTPGAKQKNEDFKNVELRYTKEELRLYIY